MDFFCPKAKLIIELDGSQHYSVHGESYDKQRTKQIETYGFTVLRYTNLDIHQRFHSVCEDIDNHVRQRVGSSF